MGAEPDLRQEEKSEGWRLKERKAHEKKNNSSYFYFFLTWGGGTLIVLRCHERKYQPGIGTDHLEMDH